MHKFLTQFALSPGQRHDLETFIFTQAKHMIMGYDGGFWDTQLIGNKFILVIPVKSERITITNYAFGGNSVITDHLTASAIFSSMATNWYMNLRAEQNRITDAAIEAISEYGFYLRDNANTLPNPGDFYSFTD